MQQLPLEQQVLLILQSSALVGLCIRVWWSGLYRIYKYFFGYLLLALLQTVILASVPFGTLLYRDAWVTTEGLIACFYALIVLELYNVLLSDLAGIATLSRRYIKVALGLAIFVSLLLLGLEKAPIGMVGHFFIFERAIVSSLLFFVFLIMGFLAYYPVPINRNAMAYAGGYAIYFMTKAAAIFVWNVGFYWTRQVSTVLEVVSTICLMFWLVALSPRGETKTVVIGHKWRPDDEERVLSQLKAINASLSRAARK
jgi:hypothetical protein